MKLIRVSSYDLYVPHADAYLVGHNLSKGREVTLPLGSYTGNSAYLSAGLYLNTRTFIWSDACSLNV